MFGESVLGASSVHIPGIAVDRPLDLSDKAVQEKLSPAANRAFFSVTTHWKLRDEDARTLLGGISNGSFYQLKRSVSKTLDQDKLTRISLLVGIFKALNILYSPKLADAWVQLANANPIFAGESPLTYMRKGGVPNMIRVRQLLDARRGGI
jgi:antitoxin Xre/MbcA/ParS-like protein